MEKRKLATIETILDLQPIEGADRIEKAKVRDWWVVVQKGLYKIDDVVIYFEIDSFLPVRKEFDFLLKGSGIKKMIVDGQEKEGIRLKTIKLRGQVSQGLLMPIHILLPGDYEIGEDVTEILGVYKYEQPIPANLSGVMKGCFPGFLRKTDEERIQNCSDLLAKHKGESFYVTEKIDGASVTYYKTNNEFGACSRNWEMKDTEGNTIWSLAKKLNLQNTLPDGYAIQGEIIGSGIQGNPYKMNEQKFYAFNIFDIGEQEFLSYDNLIEFCELLRIDIVPYLYDWAVEDDVEKLIKMADGESKINLNVLREGLVIRPRKEARDIINGSESRLSFKVISNEYLLKNEQ